MTLLIYDAVNRELPEGAFVVRRRGFFLRFWMKKTAHCEITGTHGYQPMFKRGMVIFSHLRTDWLRPLGFALGFFVFASLGSFLQGDPNYQKKDDILQVDLGDGVELSFALSGDWLLGLREASVADTPLTASETVLRPLIAQEYSNPGIWPFMKLRGVERDGERILIHTDLYGGTAQEFFREEFVFARDVEKAMGEKMTGELRALQERADAAREKLNPLVASDDSLDRIRHHLNRERERRKDIQPEMTWDVINNQVRTERFENRLRDAKRALYDDAVETSAHRQALATIERYEQAREAHIAGILSIHRDYYAFAHLQLPSETSQIVNLQERLSRHEGNLEKGGGLTWVLEREERNIAGWSWEGWSHAYKVNLVEGHEVNNLRQLGTWEIGGSVEDLTLVALRYRGLGGAEENIELGEDGQSAKRAWTTTEIIAGAAGRGPAVSPVIPPSREQSLEDRGYALQHRLGAWISKPGRGAGAPFVDFQARGDIAFLSSFNEQGALRAVTEIFPGDRFVSQLDEHWFANTDEFTTQPQLYLKVSHALGRHEMITRWQEVDQYFRDLVSENLGFQQVEALPGVGWLDEHGRPGRYRGLAEGGVENMIERGMRMKVTHTPGWYTEQHRAGPDQGATGGGNSNRVFDWVITDDVKDNWRRMTEVLAEHRVPYFIYLGGMVRPDGPFAHAIGTAPERWGMNQPDSGISHGYPPLVAHNLFIPETRQKLTDRLTDVQENLGMHGIWSDSFQNMYMSQLHWGDGSGAPMQEKWWPLLAEWTQRGIHFMSESHAFPGLSCSIELSGWEDDYYFYQHVWKWLRGTSQNRYSADQLDHMAYRFMANKSAIAPDWRIDVIPSFTRYSEEYMAALPMMRRSWVLPEGRGVLWLPFDREDEGVLFSFKEQKAPAKVTLMPILEEGSTAPSARKHYTYRVQGENLPHAFDMTPAPNHDPRRERVYEPVEWKFFVD